MLTAESLLIELEYPLDADGEQLQAELEDLVYGAVNTFRAAHRECVVRSNGQ